MNPGAYHHRRRGAGQARCVVPLALLQAVLLAGCGKKGPPLAPVVQVPQRVEQLAARRLGSEVYLELKIPDANQDGTSPADIARVEIYGYTGDPGSTADFLIKGTLVATLAVRRPPEPPSAGKGGARAADRPAKPAAPEEVGFDQGSIVVVTETLVPALMAPAAPADAAQSRVTPGAPVAAPLVGPPRGEVLARSYLAVSYSRRGRRSAPSVRVAVPVIAAPQSPVAPILTYTESHFVLSWQPPAVVRRPVQAPAAAGVLKSVPFIEVLPASSYNVYAVDREHPLRPPAEAARQSPSLRQPVPVNEKPLAAAPFDDARFAFGVERCYVVTTVDTFGPGQVVESEPSAAVCQTPRDTFPPAAPKGLQAVAGERAISLIWEPNTEADLAGYVVLRGIAPGGTLEPLTREPIKETTYSDTSAKSGVRYVYVVVAADTAVPPNLSAPSNRAEEIAR